MKTNPAPLTRHLVERRVFRGSEMGMVDVGASGGLDARWAVYGEQLRGWGFDPLEGEIERLNALGRKNVSYHAYWVGHKHHQELFEQVPSARPDRPALSNDPGLRFSVWKVLTPAESDKTYDGSGSQRKTEQRIDLDDFFPQGARQAVDFIKTDTDGQDYEVLLGATALLRDGPVLGIQAECNFHGRLHPHAQAFANLDRFMREAGFSLFDMSVYRYSRAALPSRFVWNSPGPTEKGQLWWGDFLYFRDFGDAAYEDNWGTRPPVIKLLKLASCFELYDLADCAAEVLLKYERDLAPLIDVAYCLDLLTAGSTGGHRSYRQYVDRFLKEPTAFYASAPPLVVRASDEGKRRR